MKLGDFIVVEFHFIKKKNSKLNNVYLLCTLTYASVVVEPTTFTARHMYRPVSSGNAS